MSASPAFRQCPGCKGHLTHRNLQVFHECWSDLPKKLTADYNQSRTREERQEAHHAILRHFQEAHQQHRLSL